MYSIEDIRIRVCWLDSTISGTLQPCFISLFGFTIAWLRLSRTFAIDSDLSKECPAVGVACREPCNKSCQSFSFTHLPDENHLVSDIGDVHTQADLAHILCPQNMLADAEYLLMFPFAVATLAGKVNNLKEQYFATMSF
jgi:hypothetical protein